MKAEAVMSEVESSQAQESLKEILNALKSAEDETRRSGISRLQSLNYGSESTRKELERIALHDANESIREEAKRALDLPSQKYISSRLTSLPKTYRHLIVNEIDTWEKDGLLKKESAEVIRKRYDFDFAPQPQPKETPQPETPQPTLTQTLLSETSVKIALYLGAFFVIASAAIFAALIEMARLPILIFGSVIFGGLALAIKRKLPQPSFALFIVFSFFLLITANVLDESLSLSTKLTAVYWTAIFLTTALIWSGGTWLYDSRFFSIAAFASLTLAFYRAGNIFESNAEVYPLLLGVAALLGLAGVKGLQLWRGEKFALPLFLTTQVLQAGVFIASFSIFVWQLFDEEVSSIRHLTHIAAWGLAFVFYAGSNWLYRFPLFPWFAAGALLGLPWFVNAAFELTDFTSVIPFLLWSIILALTSETARRVEKAREYSLPILVASIFTSFFTLNFAFMHQILTALICALIFFTIYASIHFIHARKWLWAAALLHFIAGYFAFFALPQFEKVDIFFGYQLAGLSVIFLLSELLTDVLVKNMEIQNKLHPLTLRLYGAFFTLTAFIVYAFTNDEPLSASIMFFVYALLFGIYTFGKAKAAYGYLSSIFFTLAAIYLFQRLEIDAWHWAITALAVMYFIGGMAIQKYPSWSAMLKNSGLGMGALAAISAWYYGGLASAIPAAVAATLFAIEAFSRRNVWLGFPANALYLLSYFIILVELNVEQPQFFSVGAALLGIIQHYLLSRAEGKVWTFITGMVSQLTLLGTTYIQMVNTEQLGYFFVLFLQAMAVILYGVIIRSRSLVFTPIGILVLGLFTVLYSALKGISAVILVGCSGVVLLMLGILAVIMRERLAKVTEKLSGWKA